MMTFIANHLWQSTITAGAAGLLTLAFRKHGATVRYGLWLAASLKFLVPFALLVGAGEAVAWRQAAPPPAVARVVETLSVPFLLEPDAASAGTESPLAAANAGGGPAVSTLTAIWLTGAAAVLAVWGLRWRRIAAVVRAGVRVNSGPELEALRRVETSAPLAKPLTLVLTDSAIEPGVFGILRPVLIWPRSIAAHLSARQLDAILAHELAHVRRRDNLTAAAHAIVQAVFWFHPLVWWIGSRLIDERERACDEAVVEADGDPHLYAESILRTCRWCVEAPAACVAGVTGSSLDRRIRHIMSNRSRDRLTLWTRALLAAFAAAVVAVPVVAGALAAQPQAAEAPGPAVREPQLPRPADLPFEMQRPLDDLRRARAAVARAQAEAERNAAPQAPAPDAAAPRPLPAFDVTSVKPNKSGSGGISMLPAPNGGWQASNVTLGILIRIAFQVQDNQIVGGPKWLYEDRFDVLGSGNAPGAPPAPMPVKLQALLGERFGLVVHKETRDLPMFALVTAGREGQPGPKLRPSSASDCPVPPPPDGRGAPPMPQPMPPAQMQACGVMLGPGRLSSGHMTIAQLATNLSRIVGSIVVDRTRLDGYYDLTLEYAPDPSLAGRSDLPPRPPVSPELERPASDGASLFAALQEQLGLKLESTKGPVEVLVIDRARQPTEN